MNGVSQALADLSSLKKLYFTIEGNPNLKDIDPIGDGIKNLDLESLKIIAGGGSDITNIDSLTNGIARNKNLEKLIITVYDSKLSSESALNFISIVSENQRNLKYLQLDFERNGYSQLIKDLIKE